VFAIVDAVPAFIQEMLAVAIALLRKRNGAGAKAYW
jgi:hypothetical protein